MKIHQALADIMSKVGAIGKDSRNTSQGFNFRSIDAVMNELHDLFAQAKVVILPEVIEDKHEIREVTKMKDGQTSTRYDTHQFLRIKFHFVSGEDGSEVSSTVIGEGMDSGDKATNKALAIGLKYALLQMFLVPTLEQKDPDAESPEGGKPRQAQPEKPKAPQAPTGAQGRSSQDDQTGGVLVEKVFIKEGSSARGPWKRFSAKFSDGREGSTFDKKLGDLLVECEASGSHVDVGMKKDEKYPDRFVIVTVSKTGGTPAELASDDIPF